MTDTSQPAPKPLAEYPIGELYAEQVGLERVLADFKGRLVAVNAEIDTRLAPSVAAAILASKKTHGVVNAPVPLSNTLSMKIDMPKKVEWDSAKLMAVAQTLPWPQVEAIFKIEFSVPEKIYGGLAAGNPELAKLIDAARTVKYGKAKVSLVEVGGEG